MKLSVVFFTLICAQVLTAQNVAINTTGATAAASAGLDINFTNKGVLLPRVSLLGTTDVTTIAAPANSLLVYNTAVAGVSPNNVTPGFYYYNTSVLQWVRLGSAPNEWHLNGNTGTGGSYLGTNDDVDLVFKRNNIQAGVLSTTNTFFGVNTPVATAGSNNTAFGTYSLANSSSCASPGSYNTALGYSAMRFCTSGSNNTAAGAYAMENGASATCTDNVAVGYQSMRQKTDGARNVAIGNQSLFTNGTGSDNVAIGKSALYACTSGSGNVAVGTNALGALTTGTENLAIGNDALGTLNGSYNIALGNGVLKNTSGSYNIGIGGVGTTSANISGSWNIGLGRQLVFPGLTSGNSNIGIGSSTLTALTSGSQNVAVGEEALTSNISGNQNSAFGYQALRLCTGSGNVGIGRGAGSTMTSGNNNIIIGVNASVPSPSGSNQISIGNVIYSISGKVGVGNSAPTVALDITGTDAIRIPRGTTAQRPASPQAGMVRFNSTLARLEFYDGTTWVVL